MMTDLAQTLTNKIAQAHHRLLVEYGEPQRKACNFHHR